MIQQINRRADNIVSLHFRCTDILFMEVKAIKVRIAVNPIKIICMRRSILILLLTKPCNVSQQNRGLLIELPPPFQNYRLSWNF